MTVDRENGAHLPGPAAAALVRAGLHITLATEKEARDTLACLDMTQPEIDSAVRFGQTGWV